MSEVRNLHTKPRTGSQACNSVQADKSSSCDGIEVFWGKVKSFRFGEFAVRWAGMQSLAGVI